jgi:hypothetical protein
MDAQILINSVDQSAYLLSSKRSYNYCNASQEFTLDLDLSCPTTINTYDPVIIYEEGVKVLTGYVQSIKKNAPEAKIVVHGQDIYVKAIDFFVDTTYTTEFGQTVQYWVSFLLNLAGLTAVFTDGSGPFVVVDQEIGLANISDLITPLLQYAGWFCKVNPDGQIVIGKISQATTGLGIAQGTDIITMDNERSYDKTRNVALVFGGIDTTLNQFTQIFAKRKVETDFLPTDQTVVVGNHLIGDQESAEQFANELVQAFSKVTFIKNYEIIGEPLLHAGEYIEVYSDFFTGIALITNLSSSFDDNGYIMNITLDDLCPRIIASIKLQENLYAGTTADGVWKYNLYDSEWTDISSGLNHFHINDLSVDNGLYACCTPAGVYTKIINNGWRYQNLPEASGMVIGSGELLYPAVYANVYDLEVNALVTYSGAANEDTRTWLYTGTLVSGGTNFRWTSSPVYLDRYLPLGPLGSGIFPSGIIPSGSMNNGLSLIGLDMEGFYSSKYIVARDSQGEGTSEVEGPQGIIDAEWPSDRGQTIGGSNNIGRAHNSINFEAQFEDYSQGTPLDTLIWNTGGSDQAEWASNNTTVLTLIEDSGYTLRLLEDGSTIATGTGGQNLVYGAGSYFFTRQSTVAGPNRKFDIIAIDATSGAETEVWTKTATQDVFTSLTNVRMGPMLDGIGHLLYLETLLSNTQAAFTEDLSVILVRFTSTSAAETDYTSDVVGLNSYVEGAETLHPSCQATVLTGDYEDNLYITADMVAPNTGGGNDTKYGYSIVINGGFSMVFSESVELPNDPLNTTGLPMTPLYASFSAAYHLDGQSTDLRNHLGTVIYDTSTSSKLLVDINHLYTQEGTDLKKINTLGVEVYSIPIEGDLELLTEDEFITVESFDPLTVRVYDKAGGDLLHTFDITTTKEGINVVVGNYLITTSNLSAGDVFTIPPPPITVSKFTYLINTFDNEFMTTLYSGIGFSETNEDVGYPYAVYGASGIVYTNTPDHLFSGFVNAGVNTYDMAMRTQLEGTVMYSTTGNGIYKTPASGGANSLRNAVNATEIVARTYGSGEIFFSIGATAKQSVDDCSTFTDISTGLPGSLITVMRLDR